MGQSLGFNSSSILQLSTKVLRPYLRMYQYGKGRKNRGVYQYGIKGKSNMKHEATKKTCSHGGCTNQVQKGGGVCCRHAMHHR